ncbi:hypothetical protein COCNU_14G001430 [Cocos nucifera]|uniref:Uncharacterized protein n=1 Tax=Cocos nucifera TaxID=13894 RepID=A0A8K0NCJ9_COCNU|nr:hypothetical protein COCNU_14G001430 [Cocos nucifera]
MNIGDENSPLIARSIISSMETMIMALLEDISTKKSPMEEMETLDVVGPPEPVKAAEIRDVMEQVVPTPCLPPTAVQMTPLQPMPAPSVLENLKHAAKFLKNFFSPDERQYLDKQGAEHRLTDALRSLAQIGHYRASFIDSNSETFLLELTVVKKKVDGLEYLLEQEKTVNAKLVKKINRSKETIHEAREAIDQRDVEIRTANKKIENLERQRSGAKRDCC